MTTKSTDIEYFRFEEDFIEDNLRCIPMIVRLKLDRVGIKLPLKSWSRFNGEERAQLAISPCFTQGEFEDYKKVLLELKNKYSIEKLTHMDMSENAQWENPDIIPAALQEKCLQFSQQLSLTQWKNCSVLQRFALFKLSRPGHESRNFEKAMIEFGIYKNEE